MMTGMDIPGRPRHGNPDVLTNVHFENGNRHIAKVIGRDVLDDIAVLKIVENTSSEVPTSAALNRKFIEPQDGANSYRHWKPFWA